MALIGTVPADYPNVWSGGAGLNFYIDGKDSGQTSIIQQYGASCWNGIINGATWSSEGGGSWYFDGSNDRVVFGSDATTVDQSDSTHTYDFSNVDSGHVQIVIDAWIKPSTIAGSAILSKRTDNHNWPRFELVLSPTNSFDCNISAGGYGSSLMYSTGNDNIISTGTWSHIGWSFTQGGPGASSNSYANRVLWLNGVKIATGQGYYSTQRNDPGGSNRPFTMGNNVDGSSWTANWYHGYIAIVRLYSCQAGSTTEKRHFNENIIKLHYERERGRFGV